MSDVTVSYKGADIATMDASGTKTLQTQGKYCEGDISIKYVKPSGGESGGEKDVNFYDYDGSIVASYSATDFANLAQLPANPTHTGLISQGWNWTLADAQAYVAAYDNLNVGQMYVTDDGKTRIYIRLEQGRLTPYFGLAVNGTATIDWGDGSTASIVTGDNTSTLINTQHIYSAPGDYVITIVINGSASLLGIKNGSQILWKNSQVANENRCYQNSIQRVELGIGIDIGGFAFSNCYSLTSITLPSGMTSIGDYAFYNCYSLTNITLSSGMTSINNYAFSGCSSLTNITLPSGVTSIGNFVFYNCYSLASITLPSDVTSIGNNAFKDCSSLTSIQLPSGVTSISGAFSGCSSLTNITLPSGMTSIDNYAFSGCYSLTSISLPSGMTSIGDYTFQNCSSLTSITLPSGVTSIGNGAFESCSSLTNITLPSGVTSIGNYAVRGCSSLASITLPSGVTSIGNYAVRDCSSLTSITLPSGVTSIGNYAFTDCASFGEIHFKPSKPPTVSAKNAFTGIPNDCIIYVPTGKLTAYTSASNYPSKSTYTYREE